MTDETRQAPPEQPDEPEQETAISDDFLSTLVSGHDREADEDSFLDSLIESVTEIPHWLLRPIFGRKDD